MVKQMTTSTIEEKLQTRFKGKNCSISIPGYDTVYGLMDEVALQVLNKTPVVVLQMNNKRYEVSLESVLDCVKKLV